MKKVKGQIVNLVQLAEVYGVHRNTINSWLKKKLPYMKKADRSKGVEWQFDTAEVAQWREQQAVHNAVGDVTHANDEELKRRKLAAEVTIAEVDAAFKKGKVAELEECERQWINSIVELRERLRQLPARVVNMVITCSSEAEAKKILLDEIDNALTVVADEFTNTAEDITDE